MNNWLELRPRQWTLLVMPERVHLLRALGELARVMPLMVLDCGRQFDATIVARAARGRAEILERIQVQRAFICFEVAKLLERTPAGKAPVVVLDVLATFQDENVKAQTRAFLLERVLEHFQRLARSGELAVSVTPPAAQENTPLFQRLYESAGQVSMYGKPAEECQQMSLF